MVFAKNNPQKMFAKVLIIFFLKNDPRKMFANIVKLYIGIILQKIFVKINF